MEKDIRVLDMVLAAMQPTQKGWRTVAKFTIIAEPFRIKDCRLMTRDGKEWEKNWDVWLPNENIRLLRSVKDEVIERVRGEYEAVVDYYRVAAT